MIVTSGLSSRAAAAVSSLVVLALWLPVPSAAGTDGAGGRGFAGSSRRADASGPSTVAAQPAGALPGIDVSHHQDVIDWVAVAASGQRFAIAKATEGRTYIDPMYATNKAGAEANGIAFGAYHFARPDDTPNDAILEADHFVQTAGLAPGNLIPALDIERTGGLSQVEVTQWILDWLGRVTELLGVRPMVYTSPAGWGTRTGDTTAVADAGYTVLWVAHWGVDEPRLPADDWSGNGWTFWQYGNCGAIPGIQGCVDVDWFGGGDSFDPVTIPSPDVTPPVVTLTPPSGVAEPLTVAFDEVVHQVTPGNVLVRVAGTGTALDAALTCLSRKGGEVDCSTGNVRSVSAQPVAPLVLGESYEADVNPLGASVLVVDRSGNPAPASTVAFGTPSEVEQDSPAVSYGWGTVVDRRAFGRAYAVEHVTGASASFGFTGRSVTWYTVTGPSQGKAAVSIDGVRLGSFDQFASRPAFRVARGFEGLARGPHTIVIRVLGSGSRSATDTQVVIDAFGFGGEVVADPEALIAWGSVDASRASGGSLRRSDVEGASATFTFRGTGVAWYTVRDRRQGRAAIYVDGALVRTVDNYAETPTFGIARSVSGLADGPHTLRIVALGEARRAAKGSFVSIDRFALVA